MRAIRVAVSAALLGAAAVTTAGPAALAAEDEGAVTSFGFSATPATVAPGGTVTLTSEGCEVPSVTATSGAFDTVTLEEGRPGTATVDSDAEPGARYEVTFDCAGERGTTSLVVTEGGAREHEATGDLGGPGETEHPVGPGDVPETEHSTGTGDTWTGTGTADTGTTGGIGGEHAAGTRPDTPTGAQKGVKAGYGTAASGAEADGLGTAEVVTGVLLIVGALGSAVVLTRRRTADGRL
ncbi:hypothetical protein ACIGW0_11615 [Streptomyces bikiniensis]|uniref:Lipoprotein n=1 Tax=Streptomyces bikiniensis TaxID=1896 RepID=A0ABW8CR50_STRBI